MIIGILKKAGDAKELTGIGQEKEIVVLAYNSALAKKVGNGDSTSVTAGDLNAELANQGASADGDNPITVTFTTSQRQYTINNNGIIEYAGMSNKEDNPTELTISLEMIHQDVVPTTGGNVESVNDEDIPIPTGFYPVAGTSKNSGFVISSVANDDLDNTKGGNQFVWVPVDQNQKLKLEISAPENITEIKLTDPAGEQINVGSFSGKTFTNANINPTYNGEYKVEVTAGETKTQTLVVRSLYAKDAFNDYFTDEWYASEDCLNMWKARVRATTKEQVYQRLGNLADDAAFVAYAKNYTYNINGYSDPTENYANSVNTYGGFYVGRFEAGVATKRTTGNASTTVNDIISASGKPLSQKNKDSYTCITRSQASGLADAMYTGKSHLLTGAAWDRTLGWLLNTSNKTLKQINAYSTEWGNYSDDSFSSTTGIAKTGEFTQTKANNIYDLAGNAYEWTSEISPYSSSPCVYRGGSCLSTGSSSPASYRNNYNESNYYDFGRF